MENNNYLKFLINIEKKILKNYLSFKSQLKFDSKKSFQIDPVTQLDFQSEKIIRDEIKRNFINHSIVGEEYDDEIAKSAYIWYIDPIDGTKSLIMGLPTWSILISLYKGKKNIFSYAYFPILKERYFSNQKKSFKYLDKKNKLFNAIQKLNSKILNFQLTLCIH